MLKLPNNIFPDWLKRHWRVKVGLFGLATLLWFLVVTQKTYERLVWIPVQVTGLKPGKVIASEIPNKAEIKVSATGRELIRMGFASRPYLLVDLSTINYYYTFNFVPKMVVVPGGLKAQVLAVMQPDTVTVVLRDRGAVTLPVIPRIKASPAPGYTIADRVTVEPAQVKIVGPKGQFDDLRGVQTEPIELNNLKQNTEVEAALVPPVKGVAEINPPTVMVKIRVERLTERTLIGVPLRAINPPRGRELILEPMIVNLEVVGSASTLADLTADDFNVWADYREYDPVHSGRVPVHIKGPDGVESMRAKPSEVKMIVRRR